MRRRSGLKLAALPPLTQNPSVSRPALFHITYKWALKVGRIR